MQTCQAALEEATEAHLAPSVIVGISDHETGQNEEEIHCKIAVIEFLIYRACCKSFEYMIPDDHKCSHTSEAVKDCIVSFRCQCTVFHNLMIRQVQPKLSRIGESRKSVVN